MIVLGSIGPNKLMPSTRALASDLSLSRATVITAYNRLKSEGYVTGHDGSGTYVSGVLPNHPQGETVRSANAIQSRVQLAKLSTYAKRMMALPPATTTEIQPEIAFYGWRGALDAVPVRHLSQAFNHVTRTVDPQLLDYARDPLGYQPLRGAISKWLHRTRGLKCGEHQILVVNGWRQALSLIARVHVERGDVVAVENPSYPAIRQAFECEGASVLPAAVDEEGMDIAELRGAMLQHVNLVYTSPSHQHPTGAVLSLARRFELLEWAHKSGAMIIEDEHDSEFRYAGEPVPPLKSLDENQQVIFVGTFNKSLFPSLAIAYVVVPEHLVDVYCRARDCSSEPVPTLLQAALADYIQSGLLLRHVRKMHALYAGRRQCLISALEQRFGQRASIIGDAAGLHVMVRFDTFLSEADLIKKALASGVGLVGASSYYMENAPEPAAYLIGYADLSESKIKEGIKQLAAIIL